MGNLNCFVNKDVYKYEKERKPVLTCFTTWHIPFLGTANMKVFGPLILLNPAYSGAMSIRLRPTHFNTNSDFAQGRKGF